jgi:hypothetical protein
LNLGVSFRLVSTDSEHHPRLKQRHIERRSHYSLISLWAIAFMLLLSLISL